MQIKVTNTLRLTSIISLGWAERF